MLPELMGADGTPHGIDWKGERYHFQPLAFALLEKFEVEHFELAKKRLQAMKGLYSAAAFDKKADALYELYDAGDFGFLSAKGQQWAKTPAGAACLVRLSLGISDEELVPLILAKGDEIKRTMDLLLREAGLKLRQQKVAGDSPPQDTATRAQEDSFRPDRGNPGGPA